MPAAWRPQKRRSAVQCSSALPEPARCFPAEHAGDTLFAQHSMHEALFGVGLEPASGKAQGTWSALPSRVLRTGARASSSSKKMIDGAALLACKHSWYLA